MLALQVGVTSLPRELFRQYLAGSAVVLLLQVSATDLRRLCSSRIGGSPDDPQADSEDGHARRGARTSWQKEVAGMG